MGIGKLIAVFGIILALFAGVVFYQYNSKAVKGTATKNQTANVTINNKKFKVELARTDKEKQIGLSNHKSLPQDQGMLFIFDKPGSYYFWMKNMKFPIDIIFIKDDKIVSISKNAKPPAQGDANPPLIKPAGEVNRVLEINAGLADKNKFKSGDSVKIDL